MGFLKATARTSWLALISIAASGCNVHPPLVLDEFGNSELSAPEGIDPRSPHIERTTDSIDFTGIETIRIDIPMGRVMLSQSAVGSIATIQLTEIITRSGLSAAQLSDYLFQSGVSFERSFVDGSRLDVEATLAEGLLDEDILFDVRVMVPDGAHVEIIVGHGPVKVDGLVGNVEIRTSDGTIDIAGVDGNVIAETTQKPVTITEVTGDVKAVTSESDVTLRLTPGLEGRISARTTSGAILMTVASSATASLELTSIDGEVSADLSAFTVSGITTGAGFVKGVLNGGGGAIEATTSTGKITFNGM